MLSRALPRARRPDAVLVLVSRAHVVDFEALTELVLAGRFRAAIDVYPDEPFDREHPLRTAPAVVLSPHRAGLVQEALWELGEWSSTIWRRSPRAAAEAHAGGRARARDPVRAHDAAGPAAAQTRSAHRSSEPRRRRARGHPRQRHRGASSSRRSGSIPGSGTGTRRSSRSASPAWIPSARGRRCVRCSRGSGPTGWCRTSSSIPSRWTTGRARRCWGSKGCVGAPEVATSGLTQPPVIATAVRAVHEAAPDTAFLEEVVPKLEAWHEWFHRERAHPETGLITVFHGWESADNAPRFDRALARIDPEGIAPIERDRHLAGRGGRAADRSRLPALPRARPVAPRARYRPRPPSSAPFAYLDLPLNSILAVAEDDLADLQSEIGVDGRRARSAAARLRDALDSDVGRRGGRVPRTRPARRGRRHGDDRRSVSALRRRVRMPARPADGRRAPDGARPLRPRTLGG